MANAKLTATAALLHGCRSLTVELADQNILKLLLCIYRPAQSHQLFWCHLRETGAASGRGAAVHSLHLQQSSRERGTL